MIAGARNVRVALSLVASSLILSAAPVFAETIDLSSSGNWTGQPGYFSLTKNFVLPSNAKNVVLNITNFVVDDRGILTLNGAEVDATGIFATDGSVGSFNFSQNGPLESHVFNAAGPRSLVYNSTFNIGGNNSLVFQANDTNYGIFGSTLNTAANASYSFAAAVTYDLNAVPEPATWGMMILGFGFIGGALRRGRKAVTITYA